LKNLILKIEEYSIKNGELLYKYYSCKKCNCLLINPRDCLNCEDTFCFKCIYHEKENSNICPNCNSNPCKFKKSANIIKNVLKNFFVFDCPLLCGEIIKYKDLKHHILHDCKLSSKTFSCNFCNEKFCDIKNLEDEKIKLHNDNCNELFINCIFCKIPFKKSLMRDHILICEEKYKECSICKLSYKENSDELLHNVKLCNMISGIFDIIKD